MGFSFKSFKPLLFLVLTFAKWVKDLSVYLSCLFVWEGWSDATFSLVAKNCSARGWGWRSLMPACFFHPEKKCLPPVQALALWNTQHLCDSHTSCSSVMATMSSLCNSGSLSGYMKAFQSLELECYCSTLHQESCCFKGCVKWNCNLLCSGMLFFNLFICLLLDIFRFCKG